MDRSAIAMSPDLNPTEHVWYQMLICIQDMDTYPSNLTETCLQSMGSNSDEKGEDTGVEHVLCTGCSRCWRGYMHY